MIRLPLGIFAMAMLLCPATALARQTQTWTAKVALGGAYFSGDVNTLNAQAEASIDHKNTDFEFSTFGRLIYGRTGHTRDNEEESGGVKFDWKPDARFTPFVAFVAFRNPFRGYDLRLSSVAGAKWRFHETERSEVSLSAALQYDFQRYIDLTDIGDAPEPGRHFFRLSVRPKFRTSLSESVQLNGVVFIRPRIDAPSDVQVDSKLVLSNKLSNAMSLEISHEYSYESRPPRQPLAKANTSLIVDLLFKWL